MMTRRSTSTILHEHEIPAPPVDTPFGQHRMMNVRDAREVLSHANGAIPDDWLDMENLLSAYYVLGDVGRALDLSHQVLAKERNSTTLLNHVVLLETFGRFDEALDCAREAHLLNPTDPYVGNIYSSALLRKGRWSEAWPLYVKYCADFTWLRFAIPEWPGPSVSLSGKRLLVLDEGGIGDNIFFFRWIHRLKELGAHVTVKAPTNYGTLVQGYPFIDRIVAGGPRGSHIEIVPHEYDYFVAVLALGLHFGVTLDNYRWTGPYMHAPRWRSFYNRLTYPSVRPIVGFCWKSGENVSPRKHRSLTPDQTVRVLDSVPDVSWVSLVYDETPPTCDVLVIEPTLRDWRDTAAILKSLDLLVTTDTGVAHLAGALGVPTWVMLPGISAWQFLLDREYHPLYPSMRMFRNRGEGIDDAVSQCVDHLKERFL